MPTYTIRSEEQAIIERVYIIDADSEDEAIDIWSETPSDDADSTKTISGSTETIAFIEEE